MCQSVSISRFFISALQVMSVPENRLFWISLASMTFCWIIFELSGFLICPSVSSPGLMRGTLMNMSILSRIGQESFARYRSMLFGLQMQGFSRSPRNPHGHGFMAPMSEKRAGYSLDCCMRLMWIDPSSRGWRRVSRRVFGNSRNSSRKRTHLWAREISHGRASRPPPITAVLLAV